MDATDERTANYGLARRPGRSDARRGREGLRPAPGVGASRVSAGAARAATETSLREGTAYRGIPAPGNLRSRHRLSDWIIGRAEPLAAAARTARESEILGPRGSPISAAAAGGDPLAGVGEASDAEAPVSAVRRIRDAAAGPGRGLYPAGTAGSVGGRRERFGPAGGAWDVGPTTLGGSSTELGAAAAREAAALMRGAAAADDARAERTAGAPLAEDTRGAQMAFAAGLPPSRFIVGAAGNGAPGRGYSSITFPTRSGPVRGARFYGQSEINPTAFSYYRLAGQKVAAVPAGVGPAATQETLALLERGQSRAAGYYLYRNLFVPQWLSAVHAEGLRSAGPEYGRDPAGRRETVPPLVNPW